MIKLDKNQAWLLSLLAASVLISWRPLWQTFVLSWQDNEYTHILLILPITIALAVLEKRPLEKVREWDFRLGPALLVAAASIACGLRLSSLVLPSDQRLAIDMFALVLSWIGIFLLCYGARSCRLALFPLLFLFGLVPLPRAILNSIIAYLQWGSAWSTRVLFVAFDVPAFQQGNLLTIPGLVIHVAQECSSIRSSSMLVFTTMAMAHVLLHSPWRKALAIGLAVPMSVAKNGLRIFTIAMLGTRVSPGYFTGKLHRQGGILFFIVALIGELAIISLLRKGEDSVFAPPLESLPDAVVAE